MAEFLYILTLCGSVMLYMVCYCADVPVETIASFNRMKSLTSDISIVVQVMKTSTLLEVWLYKYHDSLSASESSEIIWFEWQSRVSFRGWFPLIKFGVKVNLSICKTSLTGVQLQQRNTTVPHNIVTMPPKPLGTVPS